MNILQTPVRFYPYTGGVENYVYLLSKYLVRFGHNVKVLCANEPINEKKSENIDGIFIKRLNYIKKIANTNITPSLPHKLLKENFDIIHTHIPTPWSADWSTIIAKLKKKPSVLTYHNDITSKGCAYYIAKFYNLMNLNLILNITKKIIITQPNYIKYSTFLKKYKHKIKVIPVGVDTEKFRPLNINEDENTVFFLSVLDKFHEYKGLEYLLKALKIVKNEIKDIKLIIGGEGELKFYYQRMANNMGMKKNVKFVGFIPSNKLPKYYNKCSIFVLPSYSPTQEGFGIVLLEALACKKPVITTEIVGVAKDIKEFRAGRVIKPKNVNVLANTIIEVLQDKNLRKKMGINGRMIAKKYSWEKIARSIEGIYTELIETI